MNIGKYVDLYSEELKFKRFRNNTIKTYTSEVRLFLQNFNKVVTKPSEINEQMIKKYLGSFTEHNTQRAKHSAIKCFYLYVGKQPNKFKYIEYCKRNRKLPQVLSQEEVQLMFTACLNLKHKVILSILYACGLRVSELINLKWCHVDRSRMIINIVDAKGGKDRQVPLPEKLIKVMEKYYREYKPQTYVLNGQNSIQYSDRSVLELIKTLAIKAGIKKRVYTHLMRHNSFTHMVENGVDINLIQKLAGHTSAKTTAIYTHISHNIVSKIESPLNRINI